MTADVMAPLVTVVLLGVCVLMLILNPPDATCRWCPHCQKEEKKREEKAEKSHAAYHEYLRESADDCKDPRCPGR